METIDRMEEDHTLFRSRLQVMAFALDAEEDGWFILRETGFELWKRLADHVGRESQLIRALRRDGFGEASGERMPDHHNELSDLQALNGLLASESGEALVRLRPLFLVFMARLRRRMDEQKSSLFPQCTAHLDAMDAAREEAREVRDLSVWEPHAILVCGRTSPRG